MNTNTTTSPPWVALYEPHLHIHHTNKQKKNVETMVDVFHKSFTAHPTHPLVHYFGNTLSVADVNDLSDAFARYI